MSINVAICEDKQVILNNIRTSLEKVIRQNSIDAKVSFTTNNPKTILDYAKQYTQGINAYFLDINLGTSMNGLELAKQIRTHDPNCYITFITGHPELCMTVFKYHIEAFEYLIKPISYQALEECVLSINKHYTSFLTFHKHNKNAIIKIRSGNCDYNLELQDVIYVESINQKLVVHTSSRKIEFFGYLKDIINDLNKSGVSFYRCHRSYIINVNHVKEVNYKDSYIIMSNGDKCYMSRQQKGEIKEVLDRMVRDNDISV
ncbi:MAG: LytR/AlgR family response regulator transcription factor [Caulobacteraceae bacterium]